MGRSNFTSNGLNLTNDITDPDAVGFIAANVGTGVTLSGSNSWGGMTVVQANLTLNDSGTAGRNALPNGTELRIDRGGNVMMNSAYAHVRKLSGIGSVNLGGSWAAGSLMVGGVSTTVRRPRPCASARAASSHRVIFPATTRPAR